MLLFLVGLFGFLGIHSLGIVSWPARLALIARFGEGPFKAAYAALSLLTFAAMIWGYGDAKAEMGVLYYPPSWARHVSHLLMLPVFVLLASTYAPGKIRSTVKHPMLTATKTWAVAHLISNGGVPDVLLFGGFLTWAVLDRIALKRRPQVKVPESKGWGVGDAVAIVAGLGVYAAFFLFLHQWLFGVSVR